MTVEDEEMFKNSTVCHICNLNLNGDAVRDHDHYTGLFRGAAHNQCNLLYRVPEKIPVIFHNLKGFDSHLIVNALDNDRFQQIDILPITMEKYLAMFMDDFLLIDSLAFLPSSLDNLAANAIPELKKRFLLLLLTRAI